MGRGLDVERSDEAAEGPMKTARDPEAVPDFEWKKMGGEKGIIPYEYLISILLLVYKCGQSLFWGWVEMSETS